MIATDFARMLALRLTDYKAGEGLQILQNRMAAQSLIVLAGVSASSRHVVQTSTIEDHLCISLMYTATAPRLLTDS